METIPSLSQSFYPIQFSRLWTTFQWFWVVSSPFRGSAHAVLREYIMSELLRLSAHSGCMWQKINSVQFNQKGYRAGATARKFQAFSKIIRGLSQAIRSPQFLWAHCSLLQVRLLQVVTIPSSCNLRIPSFHLSCSVTFKSTPLLRVWLSRGDPCPPG